MAVLRFEVVELLTRGGKASLNCGVWSCSRIFKVLEHSKLEHGSVVDTEPVDAEGLGCAVSGDPVRFSVLGRSSGLRACPAPAAAARGARPTLAQ